MGKSIKETLSEIHKMRENLMDAIRQERFATEPMLDDLRLLPDIYKVFCDILPNVKYTTYGRKVFTFIAFYLYAPRKFFGGRMPKGLRPAIGRCTGTRTISKVSISSAELLILYQNYSDFRHDVDIVYDAITSKLGLS